MTLRLNGSTSGYTEIDAPAVAGSNTLVLPGGNGSADQALVTNGSGTLSFAARGRMVLETAKAWNWNGLTTNTNLDFTSIPSWVKRVTVIMDGVSTSGTSNILIRLGTSGGVANTGYLSSGSGISNVVGTSSSTAGFLISDDTSNTAAHTGLLTFAASGNVWHQSGSLRSLSGKTSVSGGSVTLSSVLTQVRITTVNGTDTFDAGTINLLLEG